MTKKTLSIFTFIHRWIGLIGGWFCFFLVITGTISVFDLELSQWMQPELAQYSHTQDVSAASMQKSYDLWQENNQNKRQSFIVLPSERYPFTQILYSQGALLNWQNIDSITGQVIPTQPTVGGYFFDSLHNSLLMGRPVGHIVIIVLSIIFFVLIITGFVIHLKNLVKEFFKVRPKASLRFVLDLHIGIGVFFLPFLLLIVISGFLFYAPKYMPFLQTTPNHYHSTTYKETQLIKEISQKNLYHLVQEAKTTFNAMPGFILITPQNIKVVQSDASQLAIMRNYIELDRHSNQISLNTNQPTVGRYFYNLLFGLHLARAGGDALRVVYFIAGICLSILVATGLLFFSNKRRNFNKKNISAKLLFFYKVIDGVNVGVIMGALLAMLAVLWANVLVLVENIQKPFWEIVAFFVIFILSFVEGIFYSFYSSVIKAWQHQIGLFAGLIILLPIVKMVFFPEILNSFLNDNFIYTMVNIIFITIGIFFSLLYFYLNKKNVFTIEKRK